MDLISFVFNSRVKFYFTGKGSVSRIMGLLGFGFLALFYGFVLGFFLDNSYRENISFDRLNFIKGLNLFLLVSTLTRAYIPSYKPKQDFISHVYPLSHGRRFIIDILVDYLYPYFLVLFLFITVIKITSSTFDLIYYLQSVMVLFSSHALRRIIQTFAEKKIKASFIEIVLIIAGAVIPCFIILQNNVLKVNHTLLSLLLTLLAMFNLIVVDYLLSASVVEQKRSSKGALFERGIFNTFSTTFIFKNKFARKTLLVAFLLKLLIMIVDLLMMANNGTHLFNNVYVVWIYVSPLILYSYIYSNMWGFYRTLWLTVDKCTSGFKALFMIQLRLMFIPFLLDCLLALSYFLITGKDIAFGFLFYFISLVMIICLSIFSSLSAARFVEKPLSFRANSSVAFRFASVFAVMSLVAIKYYPKFIWAVILYLIGSYILMKLSFDKYDGKYKYDVFEKLFKSGASG